MAGSPPPSRDTVDRNVQLVERTLSGHTRSNTPEKIGNGSSSKAIRLPPATKPQIAHITPFMENSRGWHSASTMSSLSSSVGAPRHIGIKKLPLMETPAPSPCPAGTLHTSAMAGLHGMALKGALAPHREVAELLYLQKQHSVKIQEATANTVQQMQGEKCMQKGMIMSTFPPVSPRKGSCIVRGAAQQRLKRIAANKSLHMLSPFYNVMHNTAKISPSGYRGPVKLISVDELERFRTVSPSSRPCERGHHSARLEKQNLEDHSLHNAGEWADTAVDDICGERSSKICREAVVDPLQPPWPNHNLPSGLMTLENGNTARLNKHCRPERSLSPSPMKLPRIERNRHIKQQRNRAKESRGEPWGAGLTTGWGLSMQNDDEAEMQEDLELLQVCASVACRQEEWDLVPSPN